jgi:hypothetical protein
VRDIYCAGEPTGIGGVDRALVEGQIAGFAATDQTERPEGFFSDKARALRFTQAMDNAFALRPELKELAMLDTIVCRCEDVTAGGSILAKTAMPPSCTRAAAWDRARTAFVAALRACFSPGSRNMCACRFLPPMSEHRWEREPTRRESNPLNMNPKQTKGAI